MIWFVDQQRVVIPNKWPAIHEDIFMDGCSQTKNKKCNNKALGVGDTRNLKDQGDVEMMSSMRD